MSTNTKNVTWVVVAAVVVVGGSLWWMSMSKTAVSPTYSNQTPSADNSNAAFDADLSNVDSQMNGFPSDNASMDAGLNDQPIQQ